jgi:hypothetical protein
VLLATLVYAQTAPSPSGADLKVKHMLAGRRFRGAKRYRQTLFFNAY